MFEELLTGEITLVDTLLFEALDDLSFGSDTSVVSTWCPTSVLALQASTTNKNILDGIVEYVSHV